MSLDELKQIDEALAQQTHGELTELKGLYNSLDEDEKQEPAGKRLLQKIINETIYEEDRRRYAKSLGLK